MNSEMITLRISLGYQVLSIENEMINRNQSWCCFNVHLMIFLFLILKELFFSTNQQCFIL